jgi:hypothetical protein
MLLTPPTSPYYASVMPTDPANLAAFIAACLMLAGVVRFASKSPTPKEPPMYGDLSRVSPPQAHRIHNAREYRRLTPTSPGVTLDTDDALSFDFGAMESRALRVRAKVDTYAAQEVIAWREIIGDPEVMRAMVRHPNRHVAKRARLAVWKRERLAAKGGGAA